MSPPSHGSRGFFHTITVVMVAAGIGGVGSYAATMRRVDALEGELAARPRIAVVDFRPIIESAAKGAKAEEIERAAMDLRDKVRKLAEAGFVVFDREAVHGVPDGFILPIDGPIGGLNLANSPSSQTSAQSGGTSAPPPTDRPLPGTPIDAPRADSAPAAAATGAGGVFRNLGPAEWPVKGSR